ncbi:MAG: single-stranded DNA-binding protein [Candidatus Zixiibacteriota bacterium]|nr:MAG: single-stranded DNA-binding protein [candidate division Zixibacteria bacterium]
MLSTRLPNLNRVMIVGNLTGAPELRSTSTGISVSNFRIAANRRFRDNSGELREDVCYVGVVAWEKLAESCAAKLQKGSAVYVEGELRSRSLEAGDGKKRNVIEIKAHHIQFLGKTGEPDEDADEFGDDEYGGNVEKYN